MKPSPSIEAAKEFTRDLIAEIVDADCRVRRDDYSGNLQIAKLIVERVGACPSQPWPVEAMRFLSLTGELAVTILADRQGAENQPGLRHLLDCVHYHTYLAPGTQEPLASELDQQRISLGVIHFAAREIAATHQANVEWAAQVA